MLGGTGRPGTRPSISVYSLGRGDLGQLGVGDDSDHSSPTLVGSLEAQDIVHIAAGDYHTAFLTGEGEVFTTGSNDEGQLGTRMREGQLSPVRVAALDTHIITHVACGRTHTVAVTDTGALASWGGAEFGQLGLKDAGGIVDGVLPRIVKGSRDFHFSRVAAGAAHTVALTGSGDVYSFGQGNFGALGLGDMESRNTPALVEILWGLGVVQIACGENHSAALTVDGQVFTWGRGKYGQLGHGSIKNEARPVPVRALADQMIVQVICGGDHTLAINSEGVLFSWGRGLWGQRGLGIKEDVLSPQQVVGLDGKHVAQASAGARHSVILTEDGEIYGWGDCEQSQLGKSDSEIQLSPILLQGFEDGKRPLFVVAGGEHTLAVFGGDPRQQFTSEVERPFGGMTTKLDAASSSSGVSEKASAQEVERQSISDMEVEDNEAGTGGPLKGGRNRHGSGLKRLEMPSLLQLLQDAATSPRALPQLGHALEDTFSSVKFLTLAFKGQQSLRHRDDETGERRPRVRTRGEQVEGPGIDIDLVRTIYQGVLQLYNPEVMQRLGAAMIRLFESINGQMDHVPESRWTRVLLIGLQSPLIGEKGLGDAISAQLFGVFARISESAERIMGQWLRCYPKDIFGGRFVRGIQRFISNRENLLGGRGGVPQEIFAAVKVLMLLFEVNKKEELIPDTDFYSLVISERVHLQDDYIRWRQIQSEKDVQPLVSFCQVPFVLTPDAKSKILQEEADLQKRHVVQTSVVQQLFGNPTSPFLVLLVRRSSLIRDTLQQLAEHSFDLKKPLKVVFEGEAGVDEGGVTKEFFQLLTRDLFNVSYGMFIYSEETRNFWFNRNSMESELEFQLVGIILGLAIYNGVILDIHFPLVVYKKLMQESVQLRDLKDLQPQLAKGLEQLLDFEGDVSDTFCQNFQVTYDYFGEMRTHDLIPGGGDIAVTNENRERYVNLYVKYLLEDSVQVQFAAFARGFIQVCGGPALSLFRHEELELLICGLPHFDFDALERVTIYQNGFTKDSQVILWFWELVKGMTLEEKKQLLFFTTGNDRAPVGGLATLKFVIQRNGEDTDRLPTAHTCFNVLMLPDYSSKLRLENRLKLAMSNSTGFGLQ